MFSFSLQRIGTWESLLVPSPRGPRHWGQSPADDKLPPANNIAQLISPFIPDAPVDCAYFLIPSGFTLNGQTIHGHFFFSLNHAGSLRSQSRAPYEADDKVYHFAVA